MSIILKNGQSLIPPREAGQKLIESLEPNHIIYVLAVEHDNILSTLEKLEEEREQLLLRQESHISLDQINRIKDYSKRIVEAEPHHLREEEALFPVMRALGITGPPDIMEMEHKAIRDFKKKLFETAASFEEMNFEEYRARINFFARSIIQILTEHISKENNILFPTALKSIQEEKLWVEMGAICEDIGYCSFSPEEKIEKL